MGPGPDASPARHALREVIATLAEVPLEAVPLSGPFFEPLGLDSMMVVALAVEIQERFGVELPRTTAGMLGLNSIERMTGYIESALERGEADERV